MIRRTRRAAITVLTGALLALAACGDDDGSGPSAQPAAGATDDQPQLVDTSGEAGTPAPRPLDERVTLRVGMPAQVEPFAHVLMADEAGEFDEENLDVEISQAPPADLLLLLSQGRLDVAVTGIDAGFFNAVSRGLDVHWVSGLLGAEPGTTTGLYVRSDLVGAADFDVATLEGRTLGLPLGGPASATIRDIVTVLEEGGLTLADVQTQTLTPPDMVAALQSGAVDAAWLSDPFASRVEAEGLATQVSSLDPEVTVGGYLFGDRLAVDEREVGEAFLRAMVRTQRTYLTGDYKADPETVGMMASALGVPVEAVTATPSAVFDLAYRPRSMVELQDAFRRVGGVLQYEELLEEGAVVDTSLLASAVAD